MSSWLVETLIATSVLTALVLMIRRPIARAFGPRVAYALWLLPLLRMMLPPLPGGPVSITSVDAANAGSAHFLTSLMPVIISVWLAGAVLFFTWQMIVYFRFVRTAFRRATDKYQEGRVEIRQDTQAGSPLAYGIFSKSVLLPSDFAERFDEDEQYFAIRHELAHHARGDLVANLFALTVLSLNWFNPLAFLAFRAYRADQEAACDATVLADANADDCQAYGRALVKSAIGRAPLVACPIGVAEGLKERLGHIVAARDVAPLYQAGMMLSGVAILAGLGFTASAVTEAKPAARVSDRQVAEASLPVSSIPVHIRSAPKVARAEHAAAPQIKLAALSAPEQTTKPVAAVSPVKPVASTSAEPRPAQALASLEPALPVQTDLPVDETPKFALAGMGCAEGNQALMASEAIFEDDNGQGHIAFVLCGRTPVDGADRRTLLLGGLRMARAQIASDPNLPFVQRAHLINVIDFQIERVADIPV